MDRLLKVGDVFSSEKFESLVGVVTHRKNRKPKVDFSNLHFDRSAEINVVWTETKKGGWSRRRETLLKIGVKNTRLKNKIGKLKFKVINTALTGGGTGHGPHDIYPDGHNVVAELVDGHVTVNFFQTGCFTGLLEPKDIVLHEK